MSVSTAVVSTRSFRPRVTFRPRASWTARSTGSYRSRSIAGASREHRRRGYSDLRRVYQTPGKPVYFAAETSTREAPRSLLGPQDRIVRPGFTLPSGRVAPPDSARPSYLL